MIIIIIIVQLLNTFGLVQLENLQKRGSFETPRHILVVRSVNNTPMEDLAITLITFCTLMYISNMQS